MMNETHLRFVESPLNDDPDTCLCLNDDPDTYLCLNDDPDTCLCLNDDPDTCLCLPKSGYDILNVVLSVFSV